MFYLKKWEKQKQLKSRPTKVKIRLEIWTEINKTLNRKAMGVEVMAYWLNAHTVLTEPRLSGSHSSVTTAAGDPGCSSGLQRHIFKHPPIYEHIIKNKWTSLRSQWKQTLVPWIKQCWKTFSAAHEAKGERETYDCWHWEWKMADCFWLCRSRKGYKGTWSIAMHNQIRHLGEINMLLERWNCQIYSGISINLKNLQQVNIPN